jgi:hypothetical protein
MSFCFHCLQNNITLQSDPEMKLTWNCISPLLLPAGFQVSTAHKRNLCDIYKAGGKETSPFFALQVRTGLTVVALTHLLRLCNCPGSCIRSIFQLLQGQVYVQLKAKGTILRLEVVRAKCEFPFIRPSSFPIQVFLLTDNMWTVEISGLASDSEARALQRFLR